MPLFPAKMKCPSLWDRACPDPFILKLIFICISVSSLFISNLFQIGTESLPILKTYYNGIKGCDNMIDNYSFMITEAIKEEMHFRNITQEQMARKIGISRSSLSKILSGTYKADFQIIVELVRLLDMSIDDIVLKKRSKTKLFLEIEVMGEARISNVNINNR